MPWTLLIPMKSTDGAKTRLRGAVADPATHTLLVRAIRSDTLRAAAAATGVARIVLVVDRAGAGADSAAGAGVVPRELVQTSPGLNAGLREAAAWARLHWPGDGCAALVGDLPALRTPELAAALQLAEGHRRSFVADAAEIGTTLLAAGPGVELDPHFGAASAAAHARAAIRLDAADSLRHDVDTTEDLHSAAALGLGPATTALLATGRRPA